MITYLIIGTILGLMVTFGTIEAGECFVKEDLGVFFFCLVGWPIVIFFMLWDSEK